jgi:hypothetical protein
MEEMKWFGSGFLGVLAANNILCFGLALAEICQTFGHNDSPIRAWHVQNQPHMMYRRKSTSSSKLVKLTSNHFLLSVHQNYDLLL